MLNQFSRTALLVGQKAIAKLQQSRVAIFGIGGVGGYVAEALARSGVRPFPGAARKRILEHFVWTNTAKQFDEWLTEANGRRENGTDQG